MVITRPQCWGRTGPAQRLSLARRRLATTKVYSPKYASCAGRRALRKLPPLNRAGSTVGGLTGGPTRQVHPYLSPAPGRGRGVQIGRAHV